MKPTIAVLLAGSRHAVTDRPQRAPVESAALDIALRVAARSSVLIHAGPSSEHVLPWYSCAAELRSIHAQTAPGADPSLALAEIIREEGVRIALCGVRAQSGFSSGLTPYRVAAALGWPVVPAVNNVSISDDDLDASQMLPGGRLRDLRCRLPAVVTVASRVDSLPFAFARFRDARVDVRPIEVGPDTWRDRAIEDLTVGSAAWNSGLFEGTAAERLTRILDIPVRSQEVLTTKDPLIAAHAILNFLTRVGVLESSQSSAARSSVPKSTGVLHDHTAT